MDAFRDFMVFLQCKRFKSRCIPNNSTLLEFIEGFEMLISKCTAILEQLASGVDFSDNKIQNELRNDNIKSRFGTLQSAYAFRRLTSIHFIESTNTIIDTCSCLSAISRMYKSTEIETQSISERVLSMVNSYLTLSKITPSAPLSSFEEFDCGSDFLEFLAKKDEFRDTYRSKAEELDRMKFKRVMCYNCNEHPAVSALMPCGHAFLCLECLSDAMESQLTKKCYICGKCIEKVIRLRFSS